MGQPDKAEPHYTRAAELARRVLGHAHRNAEGALSNLYGLYRQTGRHDEGLALWRGVVDECRGQLPHGHVAIGLYLTWLGLALVEQQEYAEAEPLAREAVGILRREVPEGSLRRYLGSALSILGVSLAGQMEYEQAEPLLVEAYDELKGWSAAPDERFYDLTLANLVGLYDARGEPDKVAEWRAKPAENLRQMAERPGATAADLSSTLCRMNNLAVSYCAQGRNDEAVVLFQQVFETTKRVWGAEHPKTIHSMLALAQEYACSGRDELALALQRELAERPEASDQTLNGYAWSLLTAEPEGLRDPEAALEIALRANEMSGYQDPMLLDTLALAYHLTGDTPKAIEIQQKALDLVPTAAPDRQEYEGRLAEFQEALEQRTEGDRQGGE